MSSVEDLDQIEARVTELNMKLNAITELSSGEKLSIYDDTLYIDNRYYDILKWSQPIIRWLMSQSRENIYLFLKTNLDEYRKTMIELNDWTSIYGRENIRKREIKSIATLFICKMITGLENVSECYSDYSELNDLIHKFDKDMVLVK